MYYAAIISDAKITISLTEKFLHHFNKDIKSVVVGDVNQLMSLINAAELIDVIIIEQTETLRFVEIMKALNRFNVDLPLILMSKECDPELMSSAVNEHVDNYLCIADKEPADYYKELVDLIIFAVERYRVKRQYMLDTKRYSSLVELAKQDQYDFQAIINYALENAMYLTDSKIGYVAFVNIPENKLTMLAWSQSAMNECRVQNKQMDFKLNEAGLWAAPVRTGKTVIIDDYKTTNHVMKHGAPMGHVEMKTLMMVPIKLNGEIIGTVGVGNKAREYNTSDEYNVQQLFQEAFKIQQSVITKNRYESELAIYRKILDRSPFGVMYVTREGFKAIYNNNAASILGLKPTTEMVDLSKNRGEIVDYIIARIANYTDLDDGIVFDVGNVKWSLTINKFSEEGLDGYGVIFTEVTNILEYKSKISSDEATLRLMQGLVSNELMSVVAILKTIKDSDEKFVTIKYKLEDISRFLKSVTMMDFSNLSWVDLDEVIDKGFDDYIGSSLDIKIKLASIKVFASNSLSRVFYEYRHMVSNRCINITSIEVKFSVEDGNLKLTLMDDGVHPLSYGNNQSGMFYLDPLPTVLITQICKGNGMDVKWIPKGHSYVAEITIPPERYKIGS